MSFREQVCLRASYDLPFSEQLCSAKIPDPFFNQPSNVTLDSTPSLLSCHNVQKMELQR